MMAMGWMLCVVIRWQAGGGRKMERWKTTSTSPASDCQESISEFQSIQSISIGIDQLFGGSLEKTTLLEGMERDRRRREGVRRKGITGVSVSEVEVEVEVEASGK
jgi:hypothetical protein